MSEVLVVHLCALVLTLVAAVTDLRTQHIPNWLTLPPMLIAPVTFGAIYGATEFMMSVAGMVVCGLVPFLMFHMPVRMKKKEGGPTRAIHGGDVKLFVALGAVTGPFLGIEAQFFALIVAGIFALARLAWNGKLLRTLGNSFFVIANVVLPKKWRRDLSSELMHPVRLGVPIFLGTLLAVADKHPFLWMPG
jgi:prepilin peptidase CpaA